MNIKYAIDSMDAWLNDNYHAVVPKKIHHSHFSTVGDISKGSIEEIAHLKAMIIEMREMPTNNEDDRKKLMRWVGFMQGALWAIGYFSIDNLREMNTHE